MDLYTLVIDFKDGTFVSQCSATNKDDALYQGILKWDITNLECVISGNSRNILLENIEEEELIQLNGITNVWSCNLIHENELMLINVIATSKAV